MGWMLPEGLHGAHATVYFAALSSCDPVTGEVPCDRSRRGPRSAKAYLARISGLGAETTRTALVDLERLHLVMRGGTPSGTRVYVDLSAIDRGERRCRDCLVSVTRGDRCDPCAQATRPDRAWRVAAIQLAVAGKSPAQIHVALRVQMYPSRDDDEAQRQRGYLIPWLWQCGLLSDEWLRTWRHVAEASYQQRRRTFVMTRKNEKK